MIDVPVESADDTRCLLAPLFCSVESCTLAIVVKNFCISFVENIVPTPGAFYRVDESKASDHQDTTTQWRSAVAVRPHRAYRATGMENDAGH